MILQTKHKILLASMAYHPIHWGRKLAGKTDRATVTRSGFRWELDLGEVVDFMIYLRGAFEPELNTFLKNNLKPGDIALDIGANVGAHSLCMAQSVGPTGAAYAVEATEYAFRKLSRNLSLNPELAEQLHPLHCMLLSQIPENDALSETTTIPSSWPFGTNEQRHDTHQGVFKEVGEARLTTLDALVEELHLKRLDWVKIDVDGNEWDVLHGGRQTFARLKPSIIMEAALDYRADEDAKSFRYIHELLKDLGYQLHRLNGDKLPETMEGLRKIISKGSSMNVLALAAR